jgi:hypothetical protein
MKIDVTDTIKNYDGKIVKEDNNPLTLRTVFVASLNATEKGEVRTAEDKAKAFQISSKLYDNNEVKLTVDDMAFLKERVGKFFSPLVYGRVCELFDGEK